MSEASVTLILLILPSFTPSLAVEVLPHGLTLHCFFVQTDGRVPCDLRLHRSPLTHTAADARSRYPAGGSQGAPRAEVHQQQHWVPRNGASATVRPQANESPAVSLHGGPAGFDAAAFEPVPLDALAPGAAEAPVTAASPPGALFTEAELATLQTLLPQGAGALLRHHSRFNLDASLKEGLHPVSITSNKLTIKFTPSLDIAKEVLEAPPANGVVDLSSETSGLRLVFITNLGRAILHELPVYLSKKTAPRMKIHGGTGIEGEGQGYGQYGSAFLE
ncbi:hypothetical protein FA95DRAFT_1603826 [Auriscalpium vulgare]|uniref:Uncharacterized protein n=1 Tax=Auriscalpium vulgare TaxID=40419 RepID=A0ACB8S120_9AGAM|nr:hypothetical protein FA95DRAFT_1603826 [Auriscalpium vulgare]